MDSKFSQLMAVVVEGLFAAKCESCKSFGCCTGSNGTNGSGREGNGRSKDHHLPLCPVIKWVRNIRKGNNN